MRRMLSAWLATALLVTGSIVVAPASRVAAASEDDVPSTPALNGVACTSDTHCFAVGARYVNGSSRALIERWTGTRWVPSPAPKPPGNKVDVELVGVSCFNPTSCFAVGDYGTEKWTRTLVMYFDGAKWSIKNSPNPPGRVMALLSRITCTTGAGCIAVGAYGTANWARTLVERWDGTRWSIVKSPNPPGHGIQAQLTGVSCPTPTDCVAVGSYGTAKWERTLVERWDGSQWSIESSPNPPGRDLVGLLDVACPAVDNCNAVGYVDLERTLALHWDGSRWQRVKTPTPAGASDFVGFFGVACPAPTECLAVGVAFAIDFDSLSLKSRALTERWNGTTWAEVRNPKLAFPALIGVSCVSSTSCYAVGFDLDRGALHEHWNGSVWRLQR